MEKTVLEKSFFEKSPQLIKSICIHASHHLLAVSLWRCLNFPIQLWVCSHDFMYMYEVYMYTSVYVGGCWIVVFTHISYVCIECREDVCYVSMPCMYIPVHSVYVL